MPCSPLAQTLPPLLHASKSAFFAPSSSLPTSPEYKLQISFAQDNICIAQTPLSKLWSSSGLVALTKDTFKGFSAVPVSYEWQQKSSPMNLPFDPQWRYILSFMAEYTLFGKNVSDSGSFFPSWPLSFKIINDFEILPFAHRWPESEDKRTWGPKSLRIAIISVGDAWDGPDHWWCG